MPHTAIQGSPSAAGSAASAAVSETTLRSETSPPSDSTAVNMHALLCDLLPHFRGLGGEGNRQTLARLGRLIPLQIHEVASGTQAFDWTVPDQWTFRDAYVKDAAGKRVIDCQTLNLHLITHSRPVHQTMSLETLRPHLHTRPDQPTLVPYRHTFYTDDWGFCLSHEQLLQIEREEAGPYEVCIDADHEPGPAALVYGECVLPGETDDEVLFSAHSCHPYMANDNLSAMVVQAYLAHQLTQRRNRFTYRFVFGPSTIGALAWLKRNQDRLDRIVGGLVLANMGDAADLTYQRTRDGETAIDHAAAAVLPNDQLTDFDPTGGDERQFGSPGFNLPVGALMRSAPGEYPEYHTSADDADFVRPQQLAGALGTCMEICETLERLPQASISPTMDLAPSLAAGRRGASPAAKWTHRRGLVNACAHGEPQLGRRGVLAAIQRDADPKTLHHAVLWTLNLADGQHDMEQIATRSDLPYERIEQAVRLLEGFALLERVSEVERQGALE